MRYLLILLLILPATSSAQHASIQEKVRSFKTYPFSDPNPVLKMN